jgi:VCBS repeat-containing protein
MRSVNSNISNKSALADPSALAKSTCNIRAARFGSQLLAIEQRMLFDGALAVSIDALGLDSAQSDKSSVVDKSFDRAAILNGAAAKALANSAPRDLVVIDTSITDWQAVADAANPNSQLLLLNAEQDGLSQIANAMVGGNYKSVHIVSHGDDGKLKLGTRSVTAANIDQYSADLERIGQSLTESGDIVLYGCEIGKGAAGASFLQALARATNADVAASTNNTGGTTQGNDWALESQTGSIESLAALNTASLSSYSGVLAAYDVALTIVETSDDNTDPANIVLVNDANPGVARTVSVAPGEIVRYRMIVELAEGTTNAASIDAMLPSGLRFLNDGTAAVGFISDNGISSSVISGATISGSGSTLGSVANFRPSTAIGAAQISGGASTGAMVSFDLGNLVNSDIDAANAEFVVIEFNAMVDNASSVIVRGASQAASFNFVANVGSGISIASDIDTLKIIEPEIVNVDKRFISLTGNVATFETTFTNTGDSDADTVRIVDSFASYPNITFGPANSFTVTRTNLSGTTIVTPTIVSATGIDIKIDTVKPNDVIKVTYTATVTDVTQAVPSQDMKVTYTSLSQYGLVMQPAAAGLPSSNSLGERTGDPAPPSYGGAINTYSDLDGAGIGVISGRLWDDTPAYGAALDNTYSLGERRLGGVTVDLYDDVSATPIDSVQTAADGTYLFKGLKPGNYRVAVATPEFNDVAVGGVGVVNIHYDVGGGTFLELSDGVINVALADGESKLNQDYGFIQRNEAPVVSKPGDKTIAINSVLSFDNGSGAGSAGFVTVSDEIQNIAPVNVATLSVNNGTLDFNTSYTVPAGFSVTGRGTSTLIITGAVNPPTVGAPTINTLLAQLQYRPTTNYVGSDQLTVKIEDKGSLGDIFQGNCVPNESGLDNLSDSKVINITITSSNNPPVAVDDARSVQTNQTITNGQAINGNGLGDSTDTDPDAADAGFLTVCGVVAGNTATVGSTGVGSAIVGTWGTLTLASNGSYTYAPNLAAQALALGAIRTDQFSYCLQDPAGSKDVGVITITLTGAGAALNNPPVAVDDVRTVQGNQTITNGQAINGNGLGDVKDTDPDVADAGRLTICGVEAGNKTAVGTSGVGTAIVGTYGSLVLQSNGSYTYTPNALGQALQTGTTRVDQFSYCLQDPAGSKDVGLITINLTGVKNPPAGADKFIPLTEDIPYKITPSDFGFTDPDGDTFKAVRITELPNPAGGKLFFNGQEVIFTAANPFLTVPFADMGKLEFRPAPNVNTANLSAPPSISFQVCDSDGVLDPTPNKLTFSIAPANDPPKASQSVYDIDSSSPTCALDSLILSAGTKPGVSDPDIPADTLTVAITAAPPVTEGQYFVGNSIVPLKAGDSLTPAQLQQLCFKPNPAISGTPNSTGRIPTTPLLFTVSDGKGGQDTSGSIQVNVRPPSVISVPPLPPIVHVPPIVVPPVLPPVIIPPVGRTISTASAQRAFDDLRFSPIEDAKDLDAGGFFDAGSIKAVWNRERVAGVQVVAEEKQATPVKQEVDCVPAPKEKPKLKAVKRSVFAETLKDNGNKNFSEQLKTAQKRFKPPAKLVPKALLVKEC